jgi:hypothetical protein
MLYDFSNNGYKEFKVRDKKGFIKYTIRMKPNSILFAPKYAKGNKKWYEVPLEEFAAFAKGLDRKKAH